MQNIAKRIKSIINFVFILFITLAVIAVFLFDVIKPKDLINPYLISGITIGAIVFLFAMDILSRKFAKLTKKSEFIIFIARYR